LDGLHRAQHAERPVEAATIRYRVLMRPDEDHFAIARESGIEVRRLIAPHLRAQRPEPAADEVARLLLVGGEPETRDRGAPSSDPRELGAPPLEAVGIDHRTFSASSSGPNDAPANTSRSIALASGIARSISA